MFDAKDKSRIQKIMFVLWLICICFVFSVSCLAAEKKSVPPDSGQPTALETITVTAQKREENVQKVTTSITVLSDTTIEDVQIESTEDIWRYVPNLITSHEGSRDYFYRVKIRGVSNTGYGDPAAALYIDDVSYAGLYAFNSPMFDIERIEVLKGPQGTLYGKSTEGGIINVITKSPDNYFTAKINAEAGDYHKRQISGSINAPITKDKLYLRLAGLYSERDGYVKNLFNGEDVDNRETAAANASLYFTPTDKLSMDLKFRIHDYDDDGGYPSAPLDKARYMATTGLTDIDDFEIAYNYIGESYSKSKASSFRVKYELDFSDLISVTAYRDMDVKGSVDPDFSPLEMYFGYQRVESESLTQEFRLQSKDSEKTFKWLLGLYYSNEDKTYESEITIDTLASMGMGVPLYSKEYTFADLGAQDMAVFGQSTIRFFDDALGVTAGLRYEKSERMMDSRLHNFMGFPVIAPMKDLEQSDSLLLPKLAVDYFFTDDIMTYASVAKGYKPGGFAYAVDMPQLVRFDPETSIAYELGLKTEFPELRLRLNLVGFYTRVDDYQDRVQLDAMTVYQENATEMDIYGFELEASYGLTKTLSINGFIGYTGTEYGEYIDPMTQVNYEGNRAVSIPEYDAGLFFEYRNLFGLFARAEMQMIGSSYFDRANTEKQNAYTLYNMRMGYERDKWDIHLSIENLTNEQYFMEAYEEPTVGWVGTVGKPRTFSISFNYRF